ncbi:hypothetical protein DRJ22_03680 [Candidatus Woesearchaeota archaeon]|nr:MAG: hypothetical protein B6U93_03445 [Candidatus Woesearchaeota archaeon ex4484_78]RLE45748.1 MAG: hypothetical protein DRJ22_03680 [Candidatus Woesearchaeota archaeon]
MEKIYLVRHGQTEWNILRKIQGSKPVPLNETGRKQAEELGKKLAGLDFSVIYSSPALRTLETAKIIAKYHKGVEIIEVPDLVERSFGEFEGKSREELEKIPGIKEAWKKQGIDWKPPGGESIRELNRRVIKAFEKIAEKHKNNKNKILIVTHGGVFKIIILHLKNVSVECMFDIRTPENCEVVEISWDGEKAIVEYD